MTTQEFWAECAELGAVVVAFKAYSRYRDGNRHADDFVGLRFGCIDGDTAAVLADDALYVQVDDALSRLSEIAETPQGALELFKERRARYAAEHPGWAP